MKLKIIGNSDYNRNFRMGQGVEVDKIEYDKLFDSGYKVRVINIWKKPRWFDLGWFVKRKDDVE